MNQFPTLPLVIAKPIESNQGFEELRTLSDLLLKCAQHLGVNPNQLLQFKEIQFESIDPTTVASSVYINTTMPVKIGIKVGSSYQWFYQYPPNVPLLWTKEESEFPAWLSKLTSDELTQYGLTNPDPSFYFMLKV